jgi:hypothetical protein
MLRDPLPVSPLGRKARHVEVRNPSSYQESCATPHMCNGSKSQVRSGDRSRVTSVEDLGIFNVRRHGSVLIKYLDTKGIFIVCYHDYVMHFR